MQSLIIVKHLIECRIECLCHTQETERVGVGVIHRSALTAYELTETAVAVDDVYIFVAKCLCTLDCLKNDVSSAPVTVSRLILVDNRHSHHNYRSGGIFLSHRFVEIKVSVL